jgi:hypothetical protein
MRSWRIRRHRLRGPKVVVAGAETLVRKFRDVSDNVHAHSEAAFHAAQVWSMWCTRDTTYMFVTPAADGFGGAEALQAICKKQGVVRDVGEEGARHVQPSRCSPNCRPRLSLGIGCG